MQFKSILFVYFLSLISYTLAVQDDDNTDDNSYVDVHQHPRSSFSCEGKKVGEYYSDLTTNCQLYYVCLPNAQLKLSPTSFACPNTTRFNQATRVCSPADQVYCNIAERYYENVFGNIDSKDHRVNEYLGPEFDKTPWQINKKTTGKALVPVNIEPEYKIQPERPRPSPRTTVPKIETSQPKSDSPLHTSFALTFNTQNNPPRISNDVRTIARTRASISTSNSRRGNPLEILTPLNQPSSNRFKPTTNQNTRSRLPVYTSGRPIIVTTPTTTTTTTTTVAPTLSNSDPNSLPKNDPKSSDYTYDYVEYDVGPGNQPINNQPSALQPNLANNKPPTLPSIPSLPSVNSNLGLFSNSNIGQPINNQPPRISQPQSNAPQRNFNFNSNPFSSNPFSSNPYGNNPSSLIRQKRDNEELIKSIEKMNKKLDEEPFSCHDKLAGIGYADIQNNCRLFHICLPLGKNKLKDYTLWCETGQFFNQLTSYCEPISNNFDCKKSKDFYLYNKQINQDKYMKNKWNISKQFTDKN